MCVSIYNLKHLYGAICYVSSTLQIVTMKRLKSFQRKSVLFPVSVKPTATKSFRLIPLIENAYNAYYTVGMPAWECNDIKLDSLYPTLP
jgi:hypothetical protein